MKKTNKFVLIGILIAIIVLTIFLYSYAKTGSISPITITTLEDENSTIIITKNNLDKTSQIQMTTYSSEEEIVVPLFGDMTEFMTNMMCGIMQIAFFNESALEEWNKQVEEWNELEFTTEDESGKEIEVSEEENLLEGYTVTKFTFSLEDKDTKKKFSDCTITGPTKEEIQINIH